MQNKNNIAIILARGGSKGIKNKNLRKIKNLSLLARAIISCKLSKEFNNVYVSTDSSKIANEALKYDAKVIGRPKSISDDMASSEKGWLHALNYLMKKNNDLKLSLLVQCTSPFIFPKDIDRCYNKMLKENLGSCFSVAKDKPFLWGYVNKSPRAINHNEKKPRVRRQNFSECYRETGAFYLVEIKKFLLKKNRFFSKLGMLQVENYLDIDTENDLLLAKTIAENIDNKIGYQSYLDWRKINK